MVLRLSAESPGNRNFYLSGRVEEPISVPFELSNSGGKKYLDRSREDCGQNARQIGKSQQLPTDFWNNE